MITTVEERNSLRFYQGDVEHYEVAEGDTSFKWLFYQTKGAYNLLNVLLYPGMKSEYARFYKEHKEIPYHLFDDLEELFKIYKNIFTLMCKNVEDDSEKCTHLYRVDRMQAMEMVEAGRTYSFISCSLKNNPDSYFKKKDGILLLEWDIPLSVPHVSVNKVLKESKFGYQEEILLSPFIRFETKKEKFTDIELGYRDINNEPPKAKFNLLVSDIWEFSDKISVTLQELEEGCDKIKDILHKMKSGGTITEDEKEYYCKWKEKFQGRIKGTFDETYREIILHYNLK